MLLDSILTPEEVKRFKKSLAEFKKGDSISFEDLKKELEV
jgi:hypothetical protein